MTANTSAAALFPDGALQHIKHFLSRCAFPPRADAIRIVACQTWGNTMDQFDKMLAKFQPAALSLFRFITGLLLFQFGVAKILKFPVIPDGNPAAFLNKVQMGIAFRHRRPDRVDPGRAFAARTVHAARRLHSRRRNGVCLFHRSCAEEFLSADQRRHAGDRCSASPASICRQQAAGRSALTPCCGRSRKRTLSSVIASEAKQSILPREHGSRSLSSARIRATVSLRASQ